jgi:hypothetical protein
VNESAGSVVILGVFALAKTTFDKLTDVQKPTPTNAKGTPSGGFDKESVTVPLVHAHLSVRFVGDMKCPHMKPSGLDG